MPHSCEYHIDFLGVRSIRAIYPAGLVAPAATALIAIKKNSNVEKHDIVNYDASKHQSSMYCK